MHCEVGIKNKRRKIRGLLAIQCYLLRSEDGCLYRARVVQVGQRTAVEFFDYGNSEYVDEV